jgi:hypothetical protein
MNLLLSFFYGGGGGGGGGKQSKTVVNVVGQGHCTKHKMNAYFLSDDFRTKL